MMDDVNQRPSEGECGVQALQGLDSVWHSLLFFSSRTLTV